jgi:hypothetical protein
MLDQVAKPELVSQAQNVVGRRQATPVCATAGSMDQEKAPARQHRGFMEFWLSEFWLSDQ